MLLQKNPPLHLTYCLNIHRGESWAEQFAAVREKAVAVKERVAPGVGFGLGLRISHQAACDLRDRRKRAEARELFDSWGVYTFTLNGFPYGRFHAGRVKEQVYAPDWRTTERSDYTKDLADILADLLPDGVEGSISTVPGSFKPWIQTGADSLAMAENLAECVAHLAEIRNRTGKLMNLGLEPEPCCYLETTDETVRFFKDTMLIAGVAALARKLGCDRSRAEGLMREHLGVCFDTCHVALQFEDVAESFARYQREGIRISKVQLSAALETASSPEGWCALEPFCEPVYLHQLKGRGANGKIASWDDLPAALTELPKRQEIETLRVHFHVPMFFDSHGVLRSTRETLDAVFFAALRGGGVNHLEIESYTFDVLPAEIRPADVVESITREYEWVLGGSVQV